MEEKEGVNSFGVTVKGDEAPQRTENLNPSQFSGSAPPGMVVAPPPGIPVNAGAMVAVSDGKKKRGRPRKYAPDGSLNMALSPMPISASIPLTGEFSAWKHSAGRPMESFKKKNKLEFENPGGRGGFPVGGNFTPHVITVNAGVDVSMKIISFAQQGCRAICVLAANGAISNVTLRQANSSGGTLTYEGRFEILSLTGSFMPTDDGVTKSRSGGLSVSLAGPDGRVLGGGLAGMLVAAGPVQVVIGSFLTGQQLEQKTKKAKYEEAGPTFTLTPANPISEERNEGASSVPKPPHMNVSSVAFHGDNMNFAHGQKKIPAPENNNNISFGDPESTEQSPSNCEVSY